MSVSHQSPLGRLAGNPHRVSTPDVRTTRNPYSNAGLRGYQNVLFWGVGAGPCSGTVSWTVMESGIVGGTERRYR